MNEDRMELLLREVLKEYRRYRRGKWLARAIWMVLLVSILSYPLIEEIGAERGEHTALIDLEGVIGIGEMASAERVNEALRKAFEAKSVKGIILRINSPGGSPVQSSQINQEIDRLQVLYPDVPVYGVVEEICASGGYYVAVATDDIYVDPASIVGSIGVRLDSFGFVDAMQKLGVERRLITAGENKGILDPFLPLADGDAAFAENLLESVHLQFIASVKTGRGDRLKGDEKILFSGLFWGGEDAVRLGLADHFGSVDSVARDVIGEETIVNYTPGYGLLEELVRDMGATAMSAVSSLLVRDQIRMF